MPHHVVVAFGDQREYEFALTDDEVARLSPDQAREWLAQEFEDLECTPSNPMGKVLVLDMILNVAKFGGEKRFSEAGDWAKQFARSASVALARPVVRVDVAGFTVG